MNFRKAVIVIRVRTIGEVLDLAFRLYATFVRDYVWLGVAVLLPFAAPLAALRFAAGWPWRAIWLTAIPITTFLEAPFTIATSRLLFGERLRVTQTLSLWRGRLAAHIGASFTTVIFYALGALIVIGVVFVAVRSLFVDEAVLLENASANEARERSRRLVAERWGSAFHLIFALVATRIGVVAGFEFLGQGLVRDLLKLGSPFEAFRRDGGSLYMLAGLFAATPLVAIARFLGYIDVRTRSDGWDLQVRFMNIVAREAQRVG